MRLDNQICSLELAKQLKKLRVKNKCLFWWASFRNESSPKDQWENVYDVILSQEEKVNYMERTYLKDKKFYRAFTVAELFEMLPAYVDTKTNEPFNNFYFNLIKRSSLNIQYIINYDCDTYESFNDSPRKLMPHNIFDEKLADCLAKMLIHLIENNLMEFGKDDDKENSNNTDAKA